MHGKAGARFLKSLRLVFTLAVAIAAGFPSMARAQAGDLFRASPPSDKPPPPLAPGVPRGAQFSTGVARPAGTRAACASDRPVCIHRVDEERVPPAEALRWLAALSDAYELLVFGLGLPSPLGDFAGGSPGLDLYLEAGKRPLEVGRDAPAFGRDRASAFCRTGLAAPARRTAVLCVGEAIGWRLDAAATPHVRRAYATHLWWVAGDAITADYEAVDAVQRYPERALVAREHDATSEGSAILFELMDARLSHVAPGELATALVALSANEASPPAWRWHNEPDLMDVIRETFGPTPSQRAMLFGDLAVARAFLGSRGDGRHAPNLRWAGDAGRVRFEWRVPFSSLPRRLAPARPIEPTGASYLWLDLDDVPKNARLGFVAEWEGPVAFKWTLVLVGRDGRELRRVEVPFLERETRVERTLVDFGEARGVLIAGTNLGGLNPTYPFDPDHAPYEPHAYTVYLAKL